MTRINCIDPILLNDKALGAEYRELPRVIGLVLKDQARVNPAKIPDRYTLGKGHVKFFYDKVAYLADRYADIVEECLERGRKVQYPKLKLVGIQLERFKQWTPDREAIILSYERIKSRGGLR